MEQTEDTPAMPPEAFVAMVTQSQNLVADLDEGKRAEIAAQVIEDHKTDRESMADWLKAMQAGLDLAQLVAKEKSYPWPNAANVVFPLIAEAALQYNARAYPAIVPSGDIVRGVVHGRDPQGQKEARAQRVSQFASYQLRKRVPGWEEDTDKMLVQLPIVGTMVRKWWYDPGEGRVRCRLLAPGSFIVNDKVRNLTDAPRMSEELPLYPVEIETRFRSGQFERFEWTKDTDEQAPQDFIEQHCRLDLDEDGYPEPYVATVHVDTQTLVRLVADFEPGDVTFQRETQLVEVMQQVVDPFGQAILVPTMTEQEVVTGIMSARRGEYYVAFKFMPSMTGGFWGTGLGLLLGGMSHTINSLMNMLLDAGHMSALGGGFIGSEFRVKGGSQRFRPGEWKTVGTSGGEIRSAIVPMTFPTPDGVLFQMLGMLIEAAKGISSTKDIMSGDAQRQQTATTTLALIEQGMTLFSASYKRVYLALASEFAILCKINARNLSPEEYNAFHDGVDQQGQQVLFDPAADFGAADMDITPVADPRSVTKMQEMAKAELVNSLIPGGQIDPAAATRRVLEAASVQNIEELMPQPDPMQAQMAQMQAQMAMQMAQADIAQKMADIDLTLAKIEQARADAMKKLSDVDAERTRLQMDAMMMMLRERRNDLETFARGMGGMAGQPRDPMGAAGGGGFDPAGQGGGLGGLLGGAAPTGGGQIGIGPLGRVA